MSRVLIRVLLVLTLFFDNSSDKREEYFSYLSRDRFIASLVSCREAKFRGPFLPLFKAFQKCAQSALFSLSLSLWFASLKEEVLTTERERERERKIKI